MTMLFAHDNDVSNLFVGKVINRGERFYEEGTKGNASGNHVHMECGKGKFTGSGWHKNTAGYWSINNGKNPTECLWIDDSITVLDSYGYTFKKIEAEVVVPDTPVEEETPIVEEPTDSDLSDNSDTPNTDASVDNNTDVVKPKLIFTCKSDDIYAIELKAGQKLYLE